MSGYVRFTVYGYSDEGAFGEKDATRTTLRLDFRWLPENLCNKEPMAIQSMPYHVITIDIDDVLPHKSNANIKKYIKIGVDILIELMKNDGIKPSSLFMLRLPPPNSVYASGHIMINNDYTYNLYPSDYMMSKRGVIDKIFGE